MCRATKPSQVSLQSEVSASPGHTTFALYVCRSEGTCTTAHDTRVLLPAEMVQMSPLRCDKTNAEGTVEENVARDGTEIGRFTSG